MNRLLLLYFCLCTIIDYIRFKHAVKHRDTCRYIVAYEDGNIKWKEASYKAIIDIFIDYRQNAYTSIDIELTVKTDKTTLES